MLRVLLLDFNVRYINPTRSFLPRLLGQAFQVTAFGPGYVDQSILDLGVNEFLNSQEKFDLVIATEHVIFWSSLISPEGYRRCYAMDFPPEAVLEGKDLLEFFRGYGEPKLSLLMESDFYNFSKWHVGRLEQIGGYYAAWGKEFVTSCDALHAIEGVNLPASATDCWLDFCKKNNNKIASILHYVAPEEFCSIPIAARKLPWSVLGAPYAARKAVRQNLEQLGVKFYGRAQALKVSICSRLFSFRLFPADFLIRKMQRGFQHALRSCRYGYTCGAFVRQPIRKFFEIPAAGSVLVCQPFKGAEHCGFVDHATYIACEPENINAADFWLKNQPVLAQEIANKGREMIATLHSLDARANQLANVAAAICEQSFEGAGWIEGEFKIRKRDLHQ